MEKTITIGTEEKRITFDKKGRAYVATIDGREYHITNASIADGVLTYFVGDRTYRALVSRNALGVS